MLIKIIIFSVILSSVAFVPQVFGQSDSLGTLANQILQIQIDEKNIAVVTHELKSGSGKVFVQFFNESYSNLKVIDSNGQDLAFKKEISEDVFGISILNGARGDRIEYVVENLMDDKNGVMQLKFSYPNDSIFVFPENLKTIYVNDNRIDVSNGKKINCHGCEMKLEFIKNEPTIIKNVEWNAEKFQVEFQTLVDISNFNFEQESKLINFNIDSNKIPITITIPKKLLWNPYEVYLNDEKIQKSEIELNEDYVLLYIRPNEIGTVQIIGISAIPEFPIFVPLAIGMIIIITLQIKQKTKLHF